MNGKEIKVVEYNLTFGSSARLVNVLGLFRYKKNNNLYIVYSDTNINYNIIYYGSSHIKETSVISMECKDKKEEEIIKEYIYKVTNEEQLEDYEIIKLDNIEGIEIISSNKLEIKKEILDKLVSLTIPKKETKEEKTEKKEKKNNSKALVVLVLLLIILAIAGFLFLNKPTKSNTIKRIICTKEYPHEVLPATINEEQIFNFNISDSLESIDINQEYKFNSEDDYLDFINEGTYYKYMPEDNTEGGWDKDDENYIFKITTKERVNTGYKKPTEYEEVLSYYKKDNYTCNEDAVE